MRMSSTVPLMLLSLFLLSPVQAQEKVQISEKVTLTREPTGEGVAPEVKQDFEEFFKTLAQELRAQPASFSPECQWLISAKLVVKPRARLVELTVDSRKSAPRITTTSLPRKADYEDEAAYKEAFRSVVKLILNLTGNCG